MKKKSTVKHVFHSDSDPGKVMEWFQTFLWDYVKEYEPADPSEYVVWLENDIQLTVSIKKLN